MLNSFQLQGNLTADPELSYSGSGNAYCRFSVAWNNPSKDDDDRKVSFFDCVAFGRTAELINEHFGKGKQMLVEGRLEQSRWTDKESGKNRSAIQLIVERLHFQQGGGQSGDGGSRGAGQTSGGGGGGQPQGGDEDVPF